MFMFMFNFSSAESVVSGKVAVGVREQLWFVESPTMVESDGVECDAVNLVVFNARSKRFKKMTVLDDSSKSVVKASGDEFPANYQDACTIALTACFLKREQETNGNGLQEVVTGILEKVKNNQPIPDADQVLFQELFQAYLTSEKVDMNRPLIPMRLADLESMKPEKILCGRFRFFGVKEEPEEAAILSKDELLSKFRISNREFSEEEKRLFFDIPDWYEPSRNVLSVAERIKKSWSRPGHLRKTNVLLEGPAGTGKTMDAKVLSRLLGLPYTKVTCFSDMDSSDVVGSILPVVDEEASSEARRFPEEEEVILDPVGCYEELTGIVNDHVSVEEVLAELQKQLREYYASESGQNSPEYKYYASEIVRAFENGYLCEIQEPTCIADAAVLLILNSALEKDGVINLPTRTVRRHPEFICVMTTNRNYNGCRPLNQALRDRFDIVKNVELPDKREVANRLRRSTGCEDDRLLETVAKFMESLNVFLEDSGINASVSMRGAVNFVADCMDGFDTEESLKEDVIYKITTEKEELAEIMQFVETSTPLLSVSLL